MDYTPIDCGFHDRLESLAVRRAVVRVEVDEGDSVSVLDARIADVYAEDGVEYLRLVSVDEQDRTLRLDQLVSVDGVGRPGAA